MSTQVAGDLAPRPSPRPAPLWIRVLRVLLLSVLGLVGYVVLFEENLIYFPARYPEGNYAASAFPGGPRDVEFVASDGVRLHAWFCPLEKPLATVLLCHGNAGNLTHRLEIVHALARVGIQTFLFDYRGYGKSEGKPGEAGLYLDGQAAYDALLDQPGIDPARVFLWGESLGGGVVVQTALDRPVGGIILQSCFSSIRRMAREHYPGLHWFARTKFDNRAKLPAVQVPVLVVHGRDDTLISFAHAEDLFAAAREPKWLYPVDAADHNDVLYVGGQALLDRIVRFVSEEAPAARAGGAGR